MAIKHFSTLALAALVIILAGCLAVPSSQERIQNALALATSHGWKHDDLRTGHFVMRAFHSFNQQGNLLTVYLEGDGLAWITPTLPSTDPTPLNPVALQLALAQPSGAVAYLARPCQFVFGYSECAQRFWTNARFSREVISSTTEALDQLKIKFGAKDLQLVGYSGGATIALLVAAERQDVRNVITVAGNVDHDAWTAWHRLQPLDASDNPVRHREALQSIRQVHLVGEEDRVIPPRLTLEFDAGYRPDAPTSVVVVPAYDHICCWVDSWPVLWKRLALKIEE